MECTNLSYNLVGIGQEYPVNEEIDRSSYAFKKIELQLLSFELNQLLRTRGRAALYASITSRNEVTIHHCSWYMK